MRQRHYVYEDLNGLSDESFATVLSSCPFPLLALVMKATPETMKERMLGLLNEDKNRLVLNACHQLDLENLNMPRDSIIREVEAAQRTIIRSARVLLEDGQIHLDE